MVAWNDGKETELQAPQTSGRLNLKGQHKPARILELQAQARELWAQYERMIDMGVPVEHLPYYRELAVQADYEAHREYAAWQSNPEEWEREEDAADYANQCAMLRAEM